MKNQVKWGLFFIIFGIIISFIVFPITLIYSTPLIIIGIALIIFSKREEIIEKVEPDIEVGR